jgi:hypothetical protein
VRCNHVYGEGVAVALDLGHRDVYMARGAARRPKRRSSSISLSHGSLSAGAALSFSEQSAGLAHLYLIRENFSESADLPSTSPVAVW